MKFLADENLPRTIVLFLRSKNHHVKDIKEEQLQGLDDNEIIALAKREKRIILTVSVILFHFPRRLPTNVLIYLEAFLGKIASESIKDPFTVLLSTESIELITPL